MEHHRLDRLEVVEVELCHLEVVVAAEAVRAAPASVPLAPAPWQAHWSGQLVPEPGLAPLSWQSLPPARRPRQVDQVVPVPPELSLLPFRASR